jgi:hypothetical protein
MATARRMAPTAIKAPTPRKASATKPAPATGKVPAVRKTPAKSVERQQDPLIFSGPPGRLRADLTVANTGDRRLAIRGLTVLRKGHPDLDVQAAALVSPGATVSMEVTLPVEPGTSPGDYPAEVAVAGLRRAAVLRVEAVLSMSIIPRRLLAEPGKQEVSIVAVNEGNVDLPLALVTKGRTSDGGKEPGPDVTLTLNAPAVLAAATTSTLQGQLNVPESLEPARRHTASVPVGLADLEVIILPRKPQRRQTS